LRLFFFVFSTPIPVEDFNNKGNQKWDGITLTTLVEKNSSRAEQNLSNLIHQVSKSKLNAFAIAFVVACSVGSCGRFGSDHSSKMELKFSQSNVGSAVI
jgi:hypothetical protein